MRENEIYEGLFDQLIAENTDVDPGVMMHEPALKYKGKVFTFYYADQNAMCFKLGKEYEIESHGVTDYEFLSPFKKKPPMYAWYLVGDHHRSVWEDLAYVALEAMRT